MCDAHGSLAGASMKHIGKGLIKFLSGITFDNCHARIIIIVKRVKASFCDISGSIIDTLLREFFIRQRDVWEK